MAHLDDHVRYIAFPSTWIGTSLNSDLETNSFHMVGAPYRIYAVGDCIPVEVENPLCPFYTHRVFKITGLDGDQPVGDELTPGSHEHNKIAKWVGDHPLMLNEHGELPTAMWNYRSHRRILDYDSASVCVAREDVIDMLSR